MLRTIVVGLILTLGLLLENVAYSREKPKQRVLTLGKATDKVSEKQREFEPIIDYLASKLKDVGIEKGEVILAGNNNNATIIKSLKEGRVDIILDTPFAAFLYKAEVSATPILLAWRNRMSEYSSFVFVRRDSGIRRMEDLKGKIIAFEDPVSTSAYLLPKCSMKIKGLDLVELDHFDSSVPPGKIGYIFSGSELNISSWVYYNKVAAGALSNLDWVNSRENPEAYREEFEIIYETQKVPGMFVIVRAGLEKKLVDRIKEELLKMDKSKEGREALKPRQINRFVEITKEVLKPIEDVLKTCGEEVR